MEWKEVMEFMHEFSSLLIALSFGLAYSLYYFLYVAKKPYLACSDQRFLAFLNAHVPSIQEKFWATFWCFESRAQTILRSFLESAPSVIYESEILKMADGGQVLLDWVPNNKSPQYPDPETRPTVLILPGLTGTSGETYIRNLVSIVTKYGYRAVVFNNRGNGSRLLTARTYCAANTEDLAVVVAHIRSKYPQCPILGTGISLGGMILFSYLAKHGKDCQMVAGICVSMAWNVFESVLTLEKPGLNKHILNRTLAKGLVDNFKVNQHLFTRHIEDVDHVLKSTTIREFDDRFTAPMFGYQNWEDYYKDACIHDKVHALQVPVLCLNAADDPFSPYHAIPIKEAEQNDNIAIVVTSHGGHIGFMEGLFPRMPGYMCRLYSQYVGAIFDHGPKRLKTE